MPVRDQGVMIVADAEIKDKKKDKEEERELPQMYAAVHSAIWLIGIAVIAWRGWWWPGILILVAISGVAQALLMQMAKRDEEKAAVATSARAAAMSVPANCPTCGAAIGASSVNWTGPTTAHCPYCKAAIPLKGV